MFKYILMSGGRPLGTKNPTGHSAGGARTGSGRKKKARTDNPSIGPPSIPSTYAPMGCAEGRQGRPNFCFLLAASVLTCSFVYRVLHRYGTGWASRHCTRSGYGYTPYPFGAVLCPVLMGMMYPQFLHSIFVHLYLVLHTTMQYYIAFH